MESYTESRPRKVHNDETAPAATQIHRPRAEDHQQERLQVLGGSPHYTKTMFRIPVSAVCQGSSSTWHRLASFWVRSTKGTCRRRSVLGSAPFAHQLEGWCPLRCVVSAADSRVGPRRVVSRRTPERRQARVWRQALSNILGWRTIKRHKRGQRALREGTRNTHCIDSAEEGGSDKPEAPTTMANPLDPLVVKSSVRSFLTSGQPRWCRREHTTTAGVLLSHVLTEAGITPAVHLRGPVPLATPSLPGWHVSAVHSVTEAAERAWLAVLVHWGAHDTNQCSRHQLPQCLDT